MPCYSRILTKLTDGARVESALQSLGYATETGSIKGLRVVGTKGSESIMFERSSSTVPFTVYGDRGNLAAISRKYAEIGVRNWASKRGFSVLENDGRKMALIKRRV
jgi:hypothetical protein